MKYFFQSCKDQSHKSYLAQFLIIFMFYLKHTALTTYYQYNIMYGRWNLTDI